MMGRVTGKSIGQLFGGVVRKEVPFYIASGRRDSTPEEEADYLMKLVAETGAKAVKFRVGGRMSRNADSMPGRTESLIPLARKTLGDQIAIHADVLRGALPFRSPGRYKKGGRCLDITCCRR
ncbi:MAG: hypothetical protein ACYS30_26110 [Planctomycetota bacterium]|jgi:L-alanine-DL-glutamate epimerase-like enolase superfamily enzyme